MALTVTVADSRTVRCTVYMDGETAAKTGPTRSLPHKQSLTNLQPRLISTEYRMSGYSVAIIGGTGTLGEWTVTTLTREASS